MLIENGPETAASSTSCDAVSQGRDINCQAAPARQRINAIVYEGLGYIARLCRESMAMRFPVACLLWLSNTTRRGIKPIEWSPRNWTLRFLLQESHGILIRVVCAIAMVSEDRPRNREDVDARFKRKGNCHPMTVSPVPEAAGHHPS